MTQTCNCQIAVVGAGPAGAVAAMRLAQLGHDVCLIERDAFPRSHVGESLSGGVRVQLDFLGLGGRVAEAGFLRFSDSELRWRGEDVEHRPAHPDAMTVDRARFDAILLDAARAAGARVIQPAHAHQPRRTAEGWTFRAETQTGTTTILAGYIVDASGRRGFMARRRERTAPSLLALYGYWRGDGLPGRPRVVAQRDAWYWGSPVPGLGFNAMVFIDPSERRRAGLPATLHYRALISRCGLLTGASKLRMNGRVVACDASSFADADAIGEDFIKVGEACFAIDPISSCGVQAAMQSALAASIVVHTIRCRPASSRLAQTFYLDRTHRVTQEHARWAAQHYGEHRANAEAGFWRRRSESGNGRAVDSGDAIASLDDAQSARAQGLKLQYTPCIVGNYVEARLAAVHPTLRGPIAFIGDTSIDAALRDAGPGSAASELA